MHTSTIDILIIWGIIRRTANLKKQSSKSVILLSKNISQNLRKQKTSGNSSLFPKNNTYKMCVIYKRFTTLNTIYFGQFIFNSIYLMKWNDFHSSLTHVAFKHGRFIPKQQPQSGSSYPYIAFHRGTYSFSTDYDRERDSQYVSHLRKIQNLKTNLRDVPELWRQTVLKSTPFPIERHKCTWTFKRLKT